MMKKRKAALFLAAAVLLQSVTSYAAPSPSTRPSTTQSDRRDRDITKDYKMTDFKSAGGGSTSGTTPGIAVISNDGGSGTDQTANVELVFGAGSDPSAAGLTTDVVEKINTINNGVEPLYRTLGTPDLVGYSALTPVSTVIVKDGGQKDPQTGKILLTVYVPNLLEGLSDIQILFFNKAAGKWEQIAPTGIDYTAKQVSLSIEDGTPFSVIYKSKQ